MKFEKPIALAFIALSTALCATAAPIVPGWALTGEDEFTAEYTSTDGSDSQIALTTLSEGIPANAETFGFLLKEMEGKAGCPAFGDLSQARAPLRAKSSNGKISCQFAMVVNASGRAVLIGTASLADTSSMALAASAVDKFAATLSTSASPASRSVIMPAPSTASKTQPALTGKSEAALKAALAAVPKGNVPVFVGISGVGSFSGWPPSYIYTVSARPYFSNGYMTTCADWDPALLSPTPDSLGRAREDCSVQRWRKSGSAIEVEYEPGKWSAESESDDTVLRFKAGERLNVNFGNVGASGFSGPGMVNVGTISGDTLQLTPQGEFAAGSWSTTVVSGNGVGGGASTESRPRVGTYYLDGHLIATADASGNISRGFIAGVNDGSQLGHIYLNGTHFWKRDD